MAVVSEINFHYNNGYQIKILLCCSRYQTYRFREISRAQQLCHREISKHPSTWWMFSDTITIIIDLIPHCSSSSIVAIVLSTSPHSHRDPYKIVSNTIAIRIPATSTTTTTISNSLTTSNHNKFEDSHLELRLLRLPDRIKYWVAKDNNSNSCTKNNKALSLIQEIKR